MKEYKPWLLFSHIQVFLEHESPDLSSVVITCYLSRARLFFDIFVKP